MGSPAAFVPVVVGMLLVVLGALYVVLGAAGGERGPLRSVVRLVPFDVVNGLVSAWMVALALGLAGGLALTLAPWHPGRFILPDTPWVGVAVGIGSGIVFGGAAGRIHRLPRRLVVGAALGLAAALAAFPLMFGPTAGLGPETDVGVGTEVGLALGVLGGLEGALVGVLTGQRWTDAAEDARGGRRRLWLSMAAGAGVAVIVGLAGWLAGAFTFILPYFGGITDCPPPGECGGVQLSPWVAQALGMLYGLGLFALGGALAGGLAGALARKARTDGVAPLHWAGVTAGLATGMVAGLAVGIQHRIIGGPPSIGHSTGLIWDPASRGMGLAAGLAGGLALGALCAVLLTWAERQPGRRALVFGAVVIVLGLVAWTMPGWYVPLTAIDVP